MTLILPNKSPEAVFDKPPIKTGKKSFFARRFISLAGRPVLAEKNMPIAPSSSQMAHKCYTCMGDHLYKTTYALNAKSGFRPFHSSRLNNDDFYESHPDLTFFRNSLPQPISAIRIDKPQLQIVTRQLQQNLYRHERAAQLKTSDLPVRDHEFAPSPYTFGHLFAEELRLKEILSGQNLARTQAGMVSCVAHKGRCERISEKFPQGELFNVWENDSRPAQAVFVSLCSTSRTLALQTASIAHATSTERFFWPSPLSRKKANFAINPRSEPVFFANSREFISNLILEHHIRLEPVVELRATGSNTGNIFSKAIRQKNHREPDCSFSFTALPECKFSQPPLITERQALSVNNIQLGNAFNPPEVVTPAITRQTHRAILRKISGYNKIKFRLRLRLAREQLSVNDYLMQTLHRCPSMPISGFRSKPVPANYLPMRLALRRYCSFKFSETTAFQTRASDQFMQKRSPFKVTSARHARYTLNSLRKITEAGDLKPSNYSNSPRLWRQQAQMSPVVKSAKVFPIFYENSESIKSIKLRAASFLMYITAPHFTDICLPAHKRRLKAPPGLFSLTSGKSYSVRRKTTLRSLRFRLYPVQNGFIGDRSKALRRISNCIASMPIGSSFAQKFTMCSATSVSAKLGGKNPAFTSRLRLIPSAYRHHLPAQVKVAMALALPITGIKSQTTLQQKDFIIPQGWPFSRKSFTCKMKLSPYPFGFPAFIPDTANFACLTSRLTMKHCNEAFAHAKGCCEYILRREKPVHSVLSMKNPRRLIHQGISPVDFPGDYFVESSLSQQISISFPEKILEFPQQWSDEKLATANQISSSPGFSETLSRQQPLFAIEIGRPDNHYMVRQSRLSTRTDMPIVKRLLLRAKRFKGRFYEPFQPQISLKKSLKNSGIKINSGSTGSLPLLDCNHAFFFNDLWEPQFPQSFSSTILAESKRTPVFHARFRLFRFPYRPEVTHVYLPANSYPQVEDTPMLVDNFFSDEVRAREFNFCFSSIQKSAQNYRLELTPGIFARSEKFAPSSGNPSFSSFLPRFSGKDMPIRTFPVEFIQKFDLTRFLKPSYSGFFRLKKVIRPMIKFSSSPSSPDMQSRLRFSQNRENRIRFRGMNTTSPHWVILLRRFEQANPPTMNFSCITLPATPFPTETFCFTGHTQTPDFHFLTDWSLPIIVPARNEEGKINSWLTETILIPVVEKPFSKAVRIASCFVEGYELPEADHSTPTHREFEILHGPAAKMEIDSSHGSARQETPDYRQGLPFPAKKLQFSVPLRDSDKASFRHAEFPDWYDLATSTISEKYFKPIEEVRKTSEVNEQSDDQPG